MNQAFQEIRAHRANVVHREKKVIEVTLVHKVTPATSGKLVHLAATATMVLREAKEKRENQHVCQQSKACLEKKEHQVFLASKVIVAKKVPLATAVVMVNQVQWG